METQTSDKSRLQAIERKVQNVQETLRTRLPAQFRHEAALVCAAKWRLRALQPADASSVVKKVRLELGAFDYRVKEQAELLTRYLLELDDVLSRGDADIKRNRKALVVAIQQLLPEADALKERSAKLKQFAEVALGGFGAQSPTPSTPVDSGAESDDMHVKSLYEESEDSTEEGEDDMEDEDMEPEEEEEEGEEEVAPPQKTPSPQALDVDVNSLPEWRPYYQLQRRQDGIYLIARLYSTNPNDVRVQWNEHSGVLRISGFRLPTQKDAMMSRLSGAPTFGRFEIAEQFPRNLLDMEEATQQISEDGTLQIRMPFRAVRRPMRYNPASLFQPQDCFVW
ncbi:uncharacterized protein KRP23_14088 [Phytophthora ramorum]|uniref:uncharacterized protein n=1 Tax=Phytophthora ramorum TaxID=164328 RepID=UPI0030A42276|nr:hypothetical protein KRP23_14088 [Phytophthora ramorum]